MYVQHRRRHKSYLGMLFDKLLKQRKQHRFYQNGRNSCPVCAPDVGQLCAGILKEEADNKCHTESRFDCYEYDKEESELKTYKNKLEKGHLFYKCVECANRVLENKYIKINNLLFIILGLSILIL